MDTDQFHELHSQLPPQLEEHFPTKRSRGKTPNGSINTKLRLSAALRYAAGGSPLDIMLTHGMSHQSVYDSIWGITDAVNKTKSLDFNADGAEFPSHVEQEDIAKGFKAMSMAHFDQIVLAVDGMLVWIVQPNALDCEVMSIGGRQFHSFVKINLE